jgi:hypothetical protein
MSFFIKLKKLILFTLGRGIARLMTWRLADNNSISNALHTKFLGLTIDSMLSRRSTNKLSTA